MATEEEVRYQLTKALESLSSIRQWIEIVTSGAYRAVYENLATIFNYVWVDTQGQADVVRFARGNILRQMNFLQGEMVTALKGSEKIIYANINAGFVAHLEVVASLKAQAKLTIAKELSSAVTKIGDLIWGTEKSVVSFLMEGLNYIAGKMDLGFMNFADAIKDILGTIPDKVWGYLETWLDEEVPD